MAKIKHVNVYVSKKKNFHSKKEMNIILSRNIEKQMDEMKLSFEQKHKFIDALLYEMNH